MARKAGRLSRSAWEDPEVRVNPDAPAVAKADRQQKWLRRALLTIAFGGVPAMVFLGLSMYQQSTADASGAGVSDTSIVANDSSGKAAAISALAEWIGASPSPLPGAVVLSWDGYTVEEPPMPEDGDETKRATYAFERHAFTVQRGSTFFRASVEVAVDAIVGAEVTSAPSLIPIPPVDRVSGVDAWFATSSATVTPQMEQAIESWAAAFTSGSAESLHQVIQDQDSNRSYVPLRGVDELREVEVIEATEHPSDTVENGAELVIARVGLRLWWEGGRPQLEENERETLPEPIVYDVLIERANTATPIIVAWGPPGSGPELEAYTNAVAAIIDVAPEADIPEVDEEDEEGDG